MSTPNVIIANQLPLNQDFTALKTEGLAFIQENSGLEWTNLNPSDAGVTILDQVCFALTELGYCNDFPVKDILTDKNGDLVVKDQFYLPQDILTTSPVTIADYRKYIIDGVAGVNNAVITPVTANGPSRTYQVGLLIADAEKNNTANICLAAFFYLLKCRNLGEMFLMPFALEAIPLPAQGTITINNQAKPTQILAIIQQKIEDYIFPKVASYSYDQLVQDNTPTNEIFNGPLLQNGWIPTTALGDNKALLYLPALNNIIEGLPGIVSSAITFSAIPAIDPNTQIVSIDFLSGNIQILQNGLSVNLKQTGSTVRDLPAPENHVSFGAADKIQTPLPEGKFRDISDYYSIQNTFPEIFAVGANSITTNATDFQIAQSRQLKGYLTLFDQVLANQFAQLANVGKLFSFKNTTTATPTDEAEFYAVKDAYEKDNLQYPAPYLTFSPTYFYQSVYEIPNIRPLLKDNDTLRFSTAIEAKKKLDKDSWRAYQQDPYNPYIKGLMEIMEEYETSLVRRNAILDHLLARHGESPLFFDALINGSLYSGDPLKDQVIFKSLYLQNLGLLSYFRQKAFHPFGANKLPDLPHPIVTETGSKHFKNDNFNDFIFKSHEIDRIEHLTEQDFINYSAFELKLSLLFGLRTLYKNYTSTYLLQPGFEENLAIAAWMLKQRTGVIFIEMNLLNTTSGSTNPPDNDEVLLLFPAFITPSITAFEDRISLFLANEMPVEINCIRKEVDTATLTNLIPVFVKWRNSLIYNNVNNLLSPYAQELRNEINKLKQA